MESPVNIVKSSLNLGTIIRFFIGTLLIFAVIDVLGTYVFKTPFILNYFMSPVTSLKRYIESKKAA